MRKQEKRERKKQDRGIVDFMMVSNHFFHSLREWILEMDDPRNNCVVEDINGNICSARKIPDRRNLMRALNG